MKTDYCAYPPQIATDVEITEQRDGDRPAFIIGSASVGRYLLIRTTEHCVLQLLGDRSTPAAVCLEFKRHYGGTLQLATLTKFLTRLDETGLLAGERVAGHQPPEQQLSTQFYTRFRLFNPDPLFARMVKVLRWVWTTQFFVGSLLLMLAAALLALLNGTEVAHYGSYILREHYVAVIVAGLLVGVTHEFAHGLTCKAFGGRATEVGVLMIYYFLPALYCNVSGIHLIPQRGRRLWVIAAGVYWQLLVGTMALLLWLMLAPYTLLSDLAFIFFCGSVLDVVFNGNPLIKLDGYYFLSQALRLPNLMDRAREWWRGGLRRVLFGERGLGESGGAAARFTRREQMILAIFGLLSFIYTLALKCFIVIYLGAYLTDWFHLLGLLLTLALALFYVRRPIRQMMKAFVVPASAGMFVFRRFRLKAGLRTEEDKVADSTQTTASAENKDATPAFWRRRLVPLAIVLLIALMLCLPWNASVGNYGTLVAIPGQEAIIRAPESATLIELRVRPGDLTASGAVLGRMGNVELEEQVVEVQAELDRANADYDRLLGEWRAREESIARAEVNLRQRQIDYDEIHSEQRQIEERQRAESSTASLKYLTASGSPAALPVASHDTPPPAAADRFAAAWSSLTSFTLDLNLSDDARHRVALYAIDWDQRGRTQRVEVLDAETTAVLDSRDLSDFQAGKYLVWSLSGHVQLRVTNAGGESAVASGLFVDAAGDDPVTSVVAGTGLTGGGKGGEVTLAIADGGVSTTQLADGAVSGAKIGAGQVVRSLNGLTDNLTLAAGDHVSLTPSGNTLTISATGLGTITGVTAGTGLIGGGNSGNLMLAVSNGGIDAAQLADGAVTTSKIAAGAVGSAQLADGAVTSSKIAAGTVGSAQLASGAVNTNQLADSAVTGAKIASGQVVKSLNGLTDNLTLAAGSNVSLTPSGNTLTLSATGSIAGVTAGTGLTGGGTSGNVTLGITNGGVGTTQLADNAVTSGKIASGQVVKSLNGLTDAVTLEAGTNVTLTPSGNKLTIAAQTSGGWTDDGTVVRLSTSTDRVGIGTTSPQQTLSVNRGMNVDQANFNNGSLSSGITFGSTSDEGMASKRTAGGNQFGLDFYTDSIPRMAITNEGNVGIGTTSPQRNLSVNGAMNVDQANRNDGSLNPGITFGSKSSEGIASTRLPGANRFGLDFYTAFTPRMTITNTGNVGIGTTNPLRTLQIGPSTDALFTFSPMDVSPSAGYIRFGDKTGWKLHFGRSREGTQLNGFQPNTGTTGVLMTIQDNGNVGIGTTTPQAKLDVRGDVKLGSTGQFFAPGGEENLRIIRGYFDQAGNVDLGSGFTVAVSKLGKSILYEINFNTPFSGTPIVTANCVSGQFDVPCIANTVPIGRSNASSVLIALTDPNGNQIAGQVVFIAIGPR